MHVCTRVCTHVCTHVSTHVCRAAQIKDDAKAMFLEFDKDDSGGVDFEEFCDFITNSASSFGRSYMAAGTECWHKRL